MDENLTEEERKSAWEEFENEKRGMHFAGVQHQQAMSAASVTPESVQEMYRKMYPQLDDAQIAHAARTYILQLQGQSAPGARPAYDKTYYQQEMARIKQQQANMYPGMYRQRQLQAGDDGAVAGTSSSGGGGGGWSFTDQMAARQQELVARQQLLNQQQNYQHQLARIRRQQEEQQRVQRLQRLQQQQAATSRGEQGSSDIEEIVLDGAPQFQVRS